jgi:hypothetical protein
MLIEGGGFSLQKGAGTLVDRAVGGSLSNKHPTNRSISAWAGLCKTKSLSD